MLEHCCRTDPYENGHSFYALMVKIFQERAENFGPTFMPHVCVCV